MPSDAGGFSNVLTIVVLAIASPLLWLLPMGPGPGAYGRSSSPRKTGVYVWCVSVLGHNRWRYGDEGLDLTVAVLVACS